MRRARSMGGGCLTSDRYAFSFVNSILVRVCHSARSVSLRSEGVVQIRLTDDELWHAIAENTDEMSALVQQQVELDAGFGAPDPDSRAELMASNGQMINRHHRDYQDYVAEIRRRYPGV